MINVNSSNAHHYHNMIYPKSVYHFMALSFMTCTTYDPPNKSPTGFVDRVNNCIVNELINDRGSA